MCYVDAGRDRKPLSGIPVLYSRGGGKGIEIRVRCDLTEPHVGNTQNEEHTTRILFRFGLFCEHAASGAWRA